MTTETITHEGGEWILLRLHNEIVENLKREIAGLRRMNELKDIRLSYSAFDDAHCSIGDYSERYDAASKELDELERDIPHKS